jgi:toxin ParE1/3/4
MSSRHAVRLTAGAEQDLRILCRYRTAHVDEAAAGGLLDEIASTAAGLAHLPEHGAIPREVEQLGMTEYRQTLCHPCRMIYRIIDMTVFIVLIADGRRDMASLLERRLLTR